MTLNPHALSWSSPDWIQGLEEFARRAGLQAIRDESTTSAAGLVASEGDVDARIAQHCAALGIEAEAVESVVPDVADMLTRAGPCVLRFKTVEGERYLLVLKSRRRRLQVLAPDMACHWLSLQQIRDLLCWPHESPLTPEFDGLLETANIPARRRLRVRAALLQERLASQPVNCGWILRLPPRRGYLAQLREAKIPRRLGAMLALFALTYALEILAWTLIGQATLDGRLDLGWMNAWFLLLLSIVPISLMGNWLDATFAVEAGRLLKRQLLAGALRLKLDTVKHLGAGQLLSRVMESQALEGLALNGGLAVVVGVVELLLSLFVLTVGAGGFLHLALILVWAAVTFAVSVKYFGRLRDWTDLRLDMTHELVERMVGHRTSLAQEPPFRRDARDDQRLQQYSNQSTRLDRAIVPVVMGIPSGWMILGLIGLAPVFIAGTASPYDLAIALGGILLAHRAFSGISSGFAAIARAGNSWGQVRELFHASTHGEDIEAAAPPPLSRTPVTNAGTPLIQAGGLSFGYDASRSVLAHVDLSIAHGERLLLEGPSGGGKSTLAALLVGLRRPGAGLLLLNGLDRHTLGAGWHRMATEAPQFHENHIMSGSLAFNLLMGRAWPPSEQDLEEAQTLCEELGLGDLLSRMPAGLQQRVGETGWQLSHGERSRIFLARALLQDADFTVLDESFAALDPETLQKCLTCAFKRARTLMVIAHP